jgi:hypothetical protein
MGCGKTTFWIQVANSIGSINTGKGKEDYRIGTQLTPETVIWRGRQLDYWNTFIPTNWKRSFPQSPITRPVCVYVHENDDHRFRFFEGDSKSNEIAFDGVELSYLTYTTPEDLYAKIIPGWVNVVYEPLNYFLNAEVVEELVKRTLQSLRDKRLQKEKKRKKKEADEEERGIDMIRAPSAIFWFDLADNIVQKKPQNQFVSIFIDEAHQILPSDVYGEMWHLNAWFANSLIDFRRRNISLYLTTHEVKQLDYRVTDRILYYFWMPGSVIYERMSMLDQPITRMIDKGECIAEQTNRKWGLVTFGKIPHQPPLVNVGGMPAACR